jgi:hypothetical protein
VDIPSRSIVKPSPPQESNSSRRSRLNSAPNVARERGARALGGYPMLTEPGKEITWGELHAGVIVAETFRELHATTSTAV